MTQHRENRPDGEDLVDLLRIRARDEAERLAYVYLRKGETESDRWTYGDLDRRSRSIAARLRELCRPGDRVLLVYPSGLEFIAGFFGCLYAGLIPVPTPDLPEGIGRSELSGTGVMKGRIARLVGRIESLVRDSRARVLLIQESSRSGVEALLEGLFTEAPPLLVATDGLDDVAAPWKPPRVEAETVAYLQYTSGSLSEPKGVVVGHRHLMDNLEYLRSVYGTGRESVMVTWLPNFHDMGLILGNVLLPIFSCAPCYSMAPMDFVKKPRRWLRALHRYRGTDSAAPNFAFDLCVHAVGPREREELDLSSWRCVVNGAEPLRWATLERFAKAFAGCGFRPQTFAMGYGLAEATLLICGTPRDEEPTIREVDSEALNRNQVLAAGDGPSQILVSSGRVGGGLEVVITDPETDSRCGAGEIGEIWARGDSVTEGYWDRPEATAETFQAFRKDSGEGPFLRTGDLGFLDGEELYVTGRLKDLIIIGGKNYYPHDIEAAIEGCHDSLRLRGRVAFSVDDGSRERLIVAVEVPEDAIVAETQETLTKEIRRCVSESWELQVDEVLFLRPGSIPKTTSGKLQRQPCRAAYLADELPEWRKVPC